MAGPPAPAPARATPSRSSAPARRSARHGPPRGADHRPPSPSPSPSPSSPAPADSPGGKEPRIVVPIRLRPRVRGLPSASPSSSRVRREAPAAPRRRTVHECAEEWGKAKAAAGAPEEDCVLPFLQKGAPRKVECLICSKSVMPDERMQCSVHHCEVTLHKVCFGKSDGICPRHICFYCKRRTTLQRRKHVMPACAQCSLHENRITESVDPSNTMISWSIWPSTSEGAGPANDIKETFRRLPLPYADQEFNIDPIKKEEMESLTTPPPYVHLKHNVYFVKKKCDGDVFEAKCTGCDPPLTCQIRCSCRSVFISCSQACKCSKMCCNRPFRREKRVEIVKTQLCGWGAVALEAIEKGDFVKEFVGEVVDGVTCQERLEDMKQRGDENFYMCKVSKNFVIDATFRGNDCRFFNHSCTPNCQLENWQVNGKTRLGVFALQAIQVGDPLTYNYRFEQHFGPQTECFCGAANCRGKL
ncbi:histone-lysine N-methyltransferase ASHR3 [Lolium perenne]|uniref:histone-lysine N-methyltransferase ASHR3 n=2 Tax=Lolium TaxID=4520 RepID=UPI003A99D5CD